MIYSRQELIDAVEYAGCRNLKNTQLNGDFLETRKNAIRYIMRER